MSSSTSEGSSCLVSDAQQNAAASSEPASRKVMELEKNVFVGTYARAPVVIQSGKGCKLYDVDGKEYLDMTAGIAVNSLGHGDPNWVNAVVEQAHTLTRVSNVYYSIPQWPICMDNAGDSWKAPPVANSGTEANEAAIKFARRFQRFSHPDKKLPATEFIAFTHSFHGRTMGSVALTSKEHYRLPFEPVMSGVKFIEYGNFEVAKKAIQHGKTAAVFIEPIQGEGGIYSATKDFLRALRTACDDAGALLVFDEITSKDQRKPRDSDKGVVASCDVHPNRPKKAEHRKTCLWNEGLTVPSTLFDVYKVFDQESPSQLEHLN